MTQTTLKIISIALVILFLVIPPASAEIQTINPGATVFIGEGDLDITRAIGNSTTIAWWSSGTNNQTSAPAKVLMIDGYATQFGIRSSEFTGYTGNWYQYDTASPVTAGPLAFTVADPMLEIQIINADNGSEVSGNSVISGSTLSFRILTNQYVALDPSQRPNVDPAMDGYITVKVIDDTGTRYTELYDNSAVSHALENLSVDSADGFWGGAGHYVWNTDSTGNSDIRKYPYGTYLVSAKSDLNGLRNNYKNAGEDYTGKTVTAAKLVIISSPNPEIIEENGISVIERAALQNAAMVANITHQPSDIVQPMPTPIPDRLARSMTSDKSESVANNITELLVYWNENLNWHLTQAQIDEYTLSMENGFLKKYMTNPDYPHALFISDEHQFNREVGDALGFNQSESEDFIRVLDELEINQFRKTNSPNRERTASALLTNLPQWGTTLTKPESQSAPYAYGKIDYVYIFVNFDIKNPFPEGSQADWSQADIDAALARLETATGTQIPEDAPAQASLSNTGSYYVTRVDGQNTGDNAAAWGPGGWMEGVLYNLQFRDGMYGEPNQIIRDDFVKYQKALSNSDAVVIVFLTHDNVGGIATNPNDPVELGYADRAAVPYWKKDHLPFDPNPPAVYAHEIVHMFGALDEYEGGSSCNAQSLIAVSPMREMYTNTNHHNCVGHFDDTLMNNPYTYSYLSGSTRNFIGWGNNDGDSDIDLVDPNPWGTTYPVTSGNTAGGIIDPKGSYAVPKQGSKSYTITYNPGYALTDVTVDGVSQGAQSSFTLDNVLAAHTVTAQFSDVTIPISSTVGSHGSVVPEYPTIYVTPGESQQFSYFPDSGYAIDNVVVDSISQGPIQKYNFVNVQNTHTISATFKPYSSTYTITPGCGSGGTITPSTPVTVSAGGSQTFAITANASYEIDTILVNTVSQTITNKTSMTVTVSNVQSNSQISVTFKPAPSSYTVVPSWGSGGIISPSTPVTVPVGGSQNFTINADTTHEIDTILINTVPQAITDPKTMTVNVSNVQSNIQISATFKPASPLANFTASPTSGPAPLTVTFNDTSTGNVTGRNWTFGDGNTTNATERNPVHTYTANGTYTVSLAATNAGGSNTTTRVNYITVAPQPIVTGLSPASGPRDGGTTVIINGSGFSGASRVDFGPYPAGMVAVSDTQITVTSPGQLATGPVNVRVTTAGGISDIVAADVFTYLGPTITGLNPSSGPVSGGTTVIINGSGFSGATRVDFGPYPAGMVAVSDTQITVTTPGHGTAETVDVRVTTPSGSSGIVDADKFNYTAVLPNISGLSPTSGSIAGGTPVTIYGSGFGGTTEVDFGTLNAPILSVSDTEIHVTSPYQLAPGKVDVQVKGPYGNSDTSGTADDFTYTAAAPAVTGLSPTSGPIAGGTPVTIYGSGFGGTTEVDFGTLNAPILSVSDTEIHVTSPYQLASSIVDVQVKAPHGNSDPSGTADDFTYTVAAPVVTGLSPATGPIAGGTPVTISGSGFGGTTEVDFGTLNAPILSVSDTEIHVTSPYQLAPGIVDVQVKGPNGNSNTSGTADDFTYTDIPVVTGVSPNRGPVAGGTNVTISGSGFGGTSAVRFGSVYATILTVSDSTITVISPGQGSTGTVHVTVTKAGGTSATSDADNFTYTNGPIVTGISPTSGPKAGGTNVTISGIQFAGTSEVRFGSTYGTIKTISATTITVLSPRKYSAGTVDVRVVTANGTSAISSSDQFTYQ